MTKIRSPIRSQNLQVNFIGISHCNTTASGPVFHGEIFTSNLFLDDEDIPIKKSKNRKNERDEIMAVIRKNPEDFGVRRSSRGPPTLSESSNDDDGSTSDSSDDFKPIKK